MCIACLSNGFVTPQAGGWGVVGKRSVKASGSMSSLWTPPLRGDVSLETSKFSHTLQMAATYDKHNVSLTAALSTLEKVGGDTGPRGKGMFSLMFLTLYRMTELLSEFEKEASDAEDDPLEAEEPVHRTAL